MSAPEKANTSLERMSLALFILVLERVIRYDNGRQVEREELCMPVLLISPTAKLYNEGDIISVHASSFDAESNIRQLEWIFNFYNVNVHDW